MRKIRHCLRVSIALMNPHDLTKETLMKENIELGLTVQWFSPLLSWQEAWWRAGRHGAGEVTVISISGWAGSRKRK